MRCKLVCVGIAMGRREGKWAESRQGSWSHDHAVLAPHGGRLYRWRREVSTAREGLCDLRYTAESTDIIADVSAVGADPQFCQQSDAYCRGI